MFVFNIYFIYICSIYIILTISEYMHIHTHTHTVQKGYLCSSFYSQKILVTTPSFTETKKVTESLFASICTFKME